MTLRYKYLLFTIGILSIQNLLHKIVISLNSIHNNLASFEGFNNISSDIAITTKNNITFESLLWN